MPPPNNQNMAPDQNPRSNNDGKDKEEDDSSPSHNLWVGNLSSDTTDSDLMCVFAKYNALDSIMTYSSRNFAFVYFKTLDNARSAKEALQGTFVCGSPIKIEFARPARPGKHLWVGAISSSVTKEQLEDEFLKFGKIEEFKFIRDRNTALVDYYNLEDAVAALKNMNGKRLGGEQIRVDFLRSQLSRRENWSDYHDSRESLWMPPDAMRNFRESSQFGPKRHQSSQPYGGRRGEGQPSNILWIGYPPSVQIDEQMLHNAMILFGEIERIKSFPSRHYSFVEFRSIDEARRAKEGLEGRLFNDPRIRILFSSSEFGPGRDNNPPFFPGIRGPRPDMFFNDFPFGPEPLEIFGQTRPMGPNNFPDPNMLMTLFAPQSFDPLHAGPEFFNDFPGFPHNYPDANHNNSMATNWRRLSPLAQGILPSPGQGMRPPIRPTPGMWDGFEGNPFQREPKRSRIDGHSSVDDGSFHAEKMDNPGIGDLSFGFGPQLDRGPSVPPSNVQIQIHSSPMGLRGPIIELSGHGEHQGRPNSDHCWRGVIAKGGTPVCHARCVPIGKGIDSHLPEIVNCSARTGLDMLTKHYAEASGYEIVFFLPDSEEDFASYTEFLRYLGAKNRAGVAKFDDGTTLFLVPPSEFLTKVLKVSGPDRLYGVVLRLPQQSTGIAKQQPPPPIPPPLQYNDRQQFPPSQSDYNLVPQKDNQVLQMEYSRFLHENSSAHAEGAKPSLTHVEESRATQSVPPDYASNSAAPLQTGVSLTPELIATLAALIPANTQTPVSTTAQVTLSSSVRPPSFSSGTQDKWRQELHTMVSGSQYNLIEEQSAHPSQHLGHQFNNQAPLFSQFPTFANANVPEHSSQVILGSTQIQDPSLNLQNPSIPSRPLNNFAIPSQGGQFTVPQANQQYQLNEVKAEFPNQGGNTSRTQMGVTPLVNELKAGFPNQVSQGGQFTVPQANQQYQLQPQQYQLNGVKTEFPNQGGNTSQTQIGVTPLVNEVNAEFPNQVQQLQSSLSAPGQRTSENEADKNQRYQSTLQFAASLLLQIQQQQQQANAQASTNHQ
ncbi:flowering time control protein FPA-like [Tasmannia lanceolata]|uniref:flowering time control protein FPA-like n=1 Tax=Tasmannia lanceolata TaxID=3420 RepID=UPI004064035A